MTFIENNPIDCKSQTFWAELNDHCSLNGTLPKRHITHEASVCLFDPDPAVLIRAKRTFLFALYLCYNAKLEFNYVWMQIYAHSLIDPLIKTSVSDSSRAVDFLKNLDLRNAQLANKGLSVSFTCLK